MENMENLWRFYNGAISGVVIAESEEEAKERVNYYLSIQFDDISKAVDHAKDMVVWKVSTDDDFRDDYPYVVAVAY